MQAPQLDSSPGYENEPPASERSVQNLRDIVIDAGSVTAEEIKTLRARMTTDFQRALDFTTVQEQMVYVVLARKSFEELMDMKRKNGNRYVAGIHKCQSRVDFIIDAIPEFSVAKAQSEDRVGYTKGKQ